MKKIFVVLFIIINFQNIQSQIILEHYYPAISISTSRAFFPTYLVGYGFKYFSSDYSTQTIDIYNLNHTLFKTMNVPFITSMSYSVYYISNTLFDIDSTNIEYLWLGNHQGSNINYIHVVREDGTILMTDSNSYNYGNNSLLSFKNIFPTDSGTKMLLHYFDGSAKVYSLPGIIPCFDCSNFSQPPLINNYIENIRSGFINVFPNPSQEILIIEYKLPYGINDGEVLIVNMSGVEVKRLKLLEHKGQINITSLNISSGNYYIFLKTKMGIVDGQKQIFIK